MNKKRLVGIISIIMLVAMTLSFTACGEEIASELSMAIQDEFLKADDCDVYLGHVPTNDNIVYLGATIEQLDNKVLWGEDGDGALDIAFNMNAYHDWAYYFFGKVVGYDVASQYDANVVPSSKTFWATNKLYPVVYVGDTSYDLYMADAMGDEIDYEGAKAVYKAALDQSYADVAAFCEQEMEAMKSIAEILK